MEIFFTDYHSYRDPNQHSNDKEELVAMLGEDQLNLLKDSLKDSMATWKIISFHDPFGIVTGRPGDWVVLGKKMLKFLGVNLD